MNLSSKIPKYLIHESFGITIENIVINQMMIGEGIEPSLENFKNYKIKYKKIREDGWKVLDSIIIKETRGND